MNKWLNQKWVKIVDFGPIMVICDFLWLYPCWSRNDKIRYIFLLKIQITFIMLQAKLWNYLYINLFICLFISRLSCILNFNWCLIYQHFYFDKATKKFTIFLWIFKIFWKSKVLIIHKPWGVSTLCRGQITNNYLQGLVPWKHDNGKTRIFRWLGRENEKNVGRKRNCCGWRGVASKVKSFQI